MRVKRCALPWSDQEADKIDFWVFVLRDHDFVVDSGGWRSERKQDRCLLRGINTHFLILLTVIIMTANSFSLYRLEQHFECQPVGALC